LADTVFTIVRVRRAVPVAKTGKVVVPVNVVDSRLVAAFLSVERTERTLAPFSVDTIFKVGRIKRAVPVRRTGTAIASVDVDRPGSSRAT
jgi:LEA14-like dessication related protein